MSWGLVASAAIGVVGGAMANKSANKGIDKATQAQQQSKEAANKLQWDMYQQSRTDNEPFRQNALTAQQEYMALMGLAPYTQPQAAPQTSNAYGFTPYNSRRMGEGKFGPSIFDDRVGPGGMPITGGMPNVQTGGNTPATQVTKTPEQLQQDAFGRFRNTPGYQFGLQTGFDQVQSSAAARGGLYSGATLKALQKFGNDYADQQGYSPYMNRLASLAGMGQTANAQNAQLGMNYANQAGGNLMDAGATRASGLFQKGQNSAQLASGIAGLANQGFNNWWQQNQWGGV